MVQIGYAAALEQFAPQEILRYCQAAERSGFLGVMASDHFQPWLPQHGVASQVWAMLGAIGAATSGDLGPAAITPSFRTHPAVVAQSAATLGALYPGRAWLGVGSGDALNEQVVGEYWPEPSERIHRMFEAIDIIRKLYASASSGRMVRHRGEHFRMDSTRLWLPPEHLPPIYVATTGPVTAHRAGQVADGLITSGAERERSATLVERFLAGARERGRDTARLPRIVQLHLSWAPTEEQAREQALKQWPMMALRIRRGEIRSPFDMEQLVRSVTIEDLAAVMPISADPDVHRAWIQRYADMGYDRIYLHNVGENQMEWLEVFGREVLPKVVA